MQHKVLLELLKKLRIPSSFGSSIVADKSSVDLASTGPNVTYKKKRHRGSMTVERSTVILPLGRHSNGPSGNLTFKLSLPTFKLIFNRLYCVQNYLSTLNDYCLWKFMILINYLFYLLKQVLPYYLCTRSTQSTQSTVVPCQPDHTTHKPT